MGKLLLLAVLYCKGSRIGKSNLIFPLIARQQQPAAATYSAAELCQVGGSLCAPPVSREIDIFETAMPDGYFSCNMMLPKNKVYL